MSTAPMLIKSETARLLDSRSGACWYEVTPLSDLRSWLSSCLEAISRLATLPHGWDGLGSPPITGDALQGAIKLLSAIPEKGFPTPQICPVSGGGIQVELQVGDRELEIEFLPDGSVGVLTVAGGDPISETQLPKDRLQSLYPALLWLRNQ